MSKKIVITGDDVNPAIVKTFNAVVGGSLEGEMNAWLEGCDLMHRNIVSVRGMKASLEDTLENVGALPTLTTSSVAYWGKAYALRQLPGGEKKSLKELLRLAREAAAVFNGRKDEATGKKSETFDKAIEGKTIEQVRKATPTQSQRKRVAHHNTGNAKGAEITDTETLAKALVKAIEKGGKISDATLEALSVAVNSLIEKELAA